MVRVPCIVLALAGVLSAQSYRDLTLTRNRPIAYETLLQLRAGMLAGLPASREEPDIGYEDKYALDGHAYFHSDRFGGRDATLDAYFGRDGFYAGVKENPVGGQGSQTRLEISGRLWPFYREGFYRGDDFVPSGRYEGEDWGALLGLSQSVEESTRIELGAFYRRFSFERSDVTDPSYRIPDDFNTYGARLVLEQNTLQLDRTSARPIGGFLATIAVEREQNDSDRPFGVVGVFETTLPSGLWRGYGHIEWFFPQTDSGTWVFLLDGSWSDEKDRVYNYDAQKPIGNLWFDGLLGYRFDLGDAISFLPHAKAQYVRVLEEDGLVSDQKTFFGGGADLRIDFGHAFSFFTSYSYLDNQSREPVATSRDTFGEHRLFVGGEIRFGTPR